MPGFKWEIIFAKNFVAVPNSNGSKWVGSLVTTIPSKSVLRGPECISYAASLPSFPAGCKRGRGRDAGRRRSAPRGAAACALSRTRRDRTASAMSRARHATPHLPPLSHPPPSYEDHASTFRAVFAVGVLVLCVVVGRRSDTSPPSIFPSFP